MRAALLSNGAGECTKMLDAGYSIPDRLTGVATSESCKSSKLK